MTWKMNDAAERIYCDRPTETGRAPRRGARPAVVRLSGYAVEPEEVNPTLAAMDDL